MTDRIVLAYAGGLTAAAAIPWLAGVYGAAVVTLTLDLGQGSDLDEVRDLALAAGAVRAHVLDVREAFARDFVLPALRAGALYEGRDPMAAALGQPLIVKSLLEVASIEQATAVAHGCTGLDCERMEASARALNPDIRVIATARADEPSQGAGANLWGRVYASTPQGPDAESPTARPRSQLLEEAPDTPALVEIAFEGGVPVAINGVPMALTELIESLSIIAGQHGVGRITAGESDVAGTRSRRVCEAPAAVVLHAAHAALEAVALPRELTRHAHDGAAEYAHLVWNGRWFTAAREARDASNAKAQENMTGSVRMTLFKGTLRSSEAAVLDHAVPLA